MCCGGFKVDVLATAFLATLSLGLSLLFLSGHGSIFVAGFNTASPSQRARYDERELCLSMGRLTLGCAVGLAFMSTGLYVEKCCTGQEPAGEWLYLMGLTVLIVCIIFGSLRVGVRAKGRR